MLIQSVCKTENLWDIVAAALGSPASRRAVDRNVRFLTIDWRTGWIFPTRCKCQHQGLLRKRQLHDILLCQRLFRILQVRTSESALEGSIKLGRDYSYVTSMHSILD
jgi:hypothetical protein